MKGSVNDFYDALSKYEDHFRNLLEEAKSKGKILKYVAEFKEEKQK
jgi:aspartokinase/homoserine dehydrogenase 1